MADSLGSVRAMYVDLRRCIGCNACSLACKQEFFGRVTDAQLENVRGKDLPIGQVWSKIYGAERDSYPSVRIQTLPMRCQQCGTQRDAPCIRKCDQLGYRAINRRPDGIVTVDPKLCVGCKQCLYPVCPYDAMAFNTEKVNKLGKMGVAEKCEFCKERLDAGLPPACVITCLAVTLDFGAYDALRAKYSSEDPESMGDKVKFLYGNLGDEPKRPTNGFPNPVPFHD